MYARTLPGPEKQPQLCDFFYFYEADIQLQIQVTPLGVLLAFGQHCHILEQKRAKLEKMVCFWSH